MKIRVIKRYYDIVAKEIREVDGKVYEVSKERGEHLIKEGMAEEVKAEKASQKG